ncbi:MAG: AAA family ATPase [Pleurocapsa sp. MO_226.B13]|nr:AAA family ATPase [Pleurocapsa sp. MO_226.B13]
MYQKKGVDNSDKAVAEAIAHASERKVNFKLEELEKFALNEIGNYSWRDLQKSINQNQNLLKAKDNQYTTLSALNRELDTIRIVNEGKGSFDRVTQSKAVQEQLKDKELTEGQYNAVMTASTSFDSIIAWQGKAGAGKTYALNEFKQIAENKGYTVKGFAPSAEAAKVLGEELGIKSNTVARKLVSQPNEENKQQIWIVDEAGLLNAKDTHSLLKKAEEERARILLVGDTRQLSAVEAGNPFKSLQKAGIETAYLNQSLRQKTADLKAAVNKISDGQINDGVKILDENGRIKDSGDKRAEQIANDYINLSPEERKKTLILAGTHADREEILNEIRTRLKEEGSLGQQETVGTRLKSKDLTRTQMKYTHHYQVGDTVMPLRNYGQLEKGKLYTVAGIEKDILTLNRSGNLHYFNPSQFEKAVYERKRIGILKGDRLKWTRNDTKLGRRNGQEFNVIGINQNFATIQYDNGKRENINLNKPQNLDHALVSTTYSSQGKTANRVLVSATSDKTLSKESFYVAASRAKFNLTIYSQDQEKLLARAQESQAKLNPLEVLEQQSKAAKKIDTNLQGIFNSYRQKAAQSRLS